MEKQNCEDTTNQGHSSGDGQPRVILGRWVVVLTLVCSLMSFLGGRFFEAQKSKSELERWKTQVEYLERQLEHAKTELEYSSEPNCALMFVSASMIKPVTPHFLLTNHGPGRLDDVWLKETVFLVDSGGVHECLDLPHFEYIYYCGSIASMGSLGVGEHQRIDLGPCWGRPFDLFYKKFSGKLVSRFRLTGTALASPEFRKDFFFVIDRNGYEYIPPDEHIGGKDLEDSVIAYTHHGPRSIIRFVSFFDFHDFFKNPPRYFYQTEDGKYIPWHGPGLPPVSPATMPVYFSRYSVLPAEGGSVKLVWECDKVGPIAQIFACRPGVW